MKILKGLLIGLACLVGIQAFAFTTNPFATVLTAASSQNWTRSNGTQIGLSFTSDFTISAWVYLNAVNTAYVFVEKANFNAGTGIQYMFYTNTDNKLYLDISQDGSQTAAQYHRQVSNAALLTAINTWYHIAATYTLSTNTTVLYLNGSSVASTNTFGSGVTALFNGIQNVQIGGDSDGNSSYVDGRMDDVRMWSRALTGAQLSALYSSPCSAANGANLQLQALFDGNGNDSSGIGNTLTNNNVATFTSSSAYTCKATGALWSFFGW